MDTRKYHRRIQDLAQSTCSYFIFQHEILLAWMQVRPANPCCNMPLPIMVLVLAMFIKTRDSGKHPPPEIINGTRLQTATLQGHAQHANTTIAACIVASYYLKQQRARVSPCLCPPRAIQLQDGQCRKMAALQVYHLCPPSLVEQLTMVATTQITNIIYIIMNPKCWS